MPKNNNCPYTKVLNRLKILDEQIFQMQTNIRKVREIITLKSKTDDTIRGEETSVDSKIESFDKMRESQVEAAIELDKKNNKESK
tara:strand:+ start:485 stop:739 length:255 start_codon:yes stop_codon:yes gene_type:complete